ncbi:hypothetical protein LMG6871_01870 [Ralstonia edaphis]|uniref:hypothetical protein n=1 Tax=Ralstonia edaphi TaxID=3058599 RepID=UPI0028F66C47|nr:hypothetical protein [Ralstonia sp. LMG 6871]CAJ0716664.1 hypothetical protein LMG6871_01870 [Ralstonia sp. LMG 6871]
MSAFYSSDMIARTAALIEDRFDVAADYSKRLAVAALDGIESHGLDANDWDTVVETVSVVVASWIGTGTFGEKGEGNDPQLN